MTSTGARCSLKSPAAPRRVRGRVGDGPSRRRTRTPPCPPRSPTLTSRSYTPPPVAPTLSCSLRTACSAPPGPAWRHASSPSAWPRSSPSWHAGRSGASRWTEVPLASSSPKAAIALRRRLRRWSRPSTLAAALSVLTRQDRQTAPWTASDRHGQAARRRCCSTSSAGEGGATLDRLADALGWQRHTVRAALTRLRQGGTPVERVAGEDGRSLYRLAAPSPRSDAAVVDTASTQDSAT